jgi:hypothetical protein
MFGSRKSAWKLDGVLIIVVGLLTTTGTVHADFVFGESVNLGQPVNSPAHDGFPSVSADGLELYFSSQRPGGSGSEDLWVAKRATVDDAWTAPTNLGSSINSSAWDGSPCPSPDGLSLYFDSMRSSGNGFSDLWVTRRATKNDAWGAPENLGPPVSTSLFDEWAPDVSADELQLVFADFDPVLPGGHGGRDVWISTRSTPSDPWNPPLNLGPTVNSSAHDDMPGISGDGLVLLFASFRAGGFGARDIYASRRSTTDTPWDESVNLGPSINTNAYDQGPSLSADGTMLYLSSNRAGSDNFDLWQVPIRPVVDFNGDDHVNVQDLILLIEHWGQNEPAYDMGPMPWGDGVVDAADLEVLMRHWGEDDSFIAHWKLDETGGDIAYDSVNENHAAVLGEPMWQREMGHIDGALQFDGIDDYLVAPFILDPTKQAFSAFAWIKGGQPGQVIISQQGGFGAWLSVDSTGALATGLTFPMPAVTSDVVVTDDRWHHVGLVSDGTGMSLYVDDVEVTRTDTSPILPANGDLYIGSGSNLEAGTFWSGMIDDVRIFDRVVEP